jgi:hypothetical protein
MGHGYNHGHGKKHGHGQNYGHGTNNVTDKGTIAADNSLSKDTHTLFALKLQDGSLSNGRWFALLKDSETSFANRNFQNRIVGNGEHARVFSIRTFGRISKQ